MGFRRKNAVLYRKRLGGAMADTHQMPHSSCHSKENGRQKPPGITHIFIAGRIFKRVPADGLK